jgi:hypothetical protein
MHLQKPFNAGGTPFADLLDEITEARRNAATSNDTRLEPRVARLEHIVQQMLLGLVETTRHRGKE